MRVQRVVCLFALGASLGLAQTPDLSGVWKADLSKDNPGGPRLSGFTLLIEQKQDNLQEIAETVNQHGPYRAVSSYNLTGRETRDEVRGIPARSKASWQGAALVVESRVFNTRPEALKKTYTLSADGRTLTLETAGSMNGREFQSKVSFDKQPDSAGEALRKPEQTAGEREKNLQVLKDMPYSKFIDLMRYFNLSLGGNCETCHVQGNFASDEKKEKAIARKMISMTMAINQQYFGGKTEVRCFTCHHGVGHPQKAPIPQP